LPKKNIVVVRSGSYILLLKKGVGVAEKKSTLTQNYSLPISTPFHIL